LRQLSVALLVQLVKAFYAADESDDGSIQQEEFRLLIL
jgi:hypothetical protein